MGPLHDTGDETTITTVGKSRLATGGSNKHCLLVKVMAIVFWDNKFRGDTVTHTPYSPDIALSDYQ